ncbi:hypothetical protein [Pseudoalteromonas sp. MMG005]|uniref:hypothetical protein n=1 Tax=Pseudoalteromonas sp. MMG005 TaxID=2822682 RepID=UPI001B3A4640|nr:hypothetical protein [Pseudoalteromonas sp. MMG005]MBQ4847278.1 hypothetical protein [Pseudoalteromonas sp. MMG005]
MKYLLLTLLLVPLLAISSNKCDDVLYIGYGFNSPLNKNNPVYPISLKDLANPVIIDNADSDKTALNVLKEQGIEEYVRQSLTGTISNNMDYFGQPVSLLDIALANSAKWETIKKIIKHGIEPTGLGWKMAAMGLTDKQLIELTSLFPNQTSELNTNEEQGYTFNNLLIKEGRFDVLTELQKLGLINDSNFYYGKMVDISHYSLMERSLFSKFLDINKYQKSFDKKISLETVKQENKDKFLSKLQPFELVSLCKTNTNDSINLDSVFILTPEQFQNKLDSLDINITTKTGMDAFSEIIDEPLYQDYFSHLKSNNTIKNYTMKYINAPFDVNELATLYKNIDKNEILVDLYGLTHQEYAYFHGLEWADVNSDKFRLDVFTKNFMKFYSVGLKSRLEKDSALKKLRFHGKNLSYYATINIEDKNVLKWILAEFGQPSSLYGFNIEEQLANIACYSQIKKHDIKLINSLLDIGVKLDLKKIRPSVRTEVNKCYHFKNPVNIIRKSDDILLK